MEENSPGKWFYWVTLLWFTINLLLFIFDFLFGIFRFSAFDFYATLAISLEFVFYFLIMVYFYFKNYAIKHFVPSAIVVFWILTLLLMLSTNANLKTASDMIEFAVYVFLMVYSFRMHEEKISSLNYTFKIAQPWHTVLLFAFIAVLLQVWSAGIIVNQSLTGNYNETFKFASFLNYPGKFVNGIIGICPLNAELGFCQGALFFAVNIFLFLIMGLAAGTVAKKAQGYYL